MILTIFSSSQDNTLQEIQSFIKNKYDNTIISCDFIDNYCNHNYNEVSVLFIDNTVEIFYATPRFDLSDKILNVSYKEYCELLTDIYNLFSNDVSVCFHLLYTQKNAPFKRIINLFPEEYLSDKNYSKSISSLSEKITCSAQINPSEFKKCILINFETYNSKISTVSNFKNIDSDTAIFNSNESLINNFLNLLTHLYNDERNEIING